MTSRTAVSLGRIPRGSTDPAVGGTPKARRRPAVPRLAMALLAGWVVCCAVPGGGGAPVPAPLYVANTQDGTVTRLDAASGQALGPPLPAGSAPFLVAAGPNGAVLVMSLWRIGGGGLTHVAPVGGIWQARPVIVEPGVHFTLLASDGEGHAAAVYHGRTAGAATARWRCHLALVDVRSGVVERTHTVCGEGEQVTGLALAGGPAGPTAYVGLWRGTGTVEGQWTAARGRVLAVDMATGAGVAVHWLDGVPGPVVRPPVAGLPGSPIYAVEAVPRSDGTHPEDAGEQYAEAFRWQLLELDPATLEVQGVRALSHPLHWPVLAPDGRQLYATAGSGSPMRGGTIAIVHVDLATGAQRVLANVPGWALGGLAVTQERVYVPDVAGNRLTVLDRRTGRLLTSIPTGRHPLGIAVGGA